MDNLPKKKKKEARFNKRGQRCIFCNKFLELEEAFLSYFQDESERAHLFLFCSKACRGKHASLFNSIKTPKEKNTELENIALGAV